MCSGKLGAKEIEKMIEKVDVDGDGSVKSIYNSTKKLMSFHFRNIDFKEFKKMMAE